MSVTFINNTQEGFVIVSKKVLMDKNLSLRDRGMLVTLMSLPPEWNFSVNGMAAILPDGKDGVGSSIRNLEKHGYLKRERQKNTNGTFGGTKITVNANNDIFASDKLPMTENLSQAVPQTAEPVTENPVTAKPALDNPVTENPSQLNNKELNNKELNNKESINHQSESYTDVQQEIKDQIEYDVVKIDRPKDISYLNTILNLLTEVYLSSKSTHKIAGEEMNADMVKAKLRRLTYSNVEYVIDSIRSQVNEIKNPKAYLLTTLYNAPEYEDMHWDNLARKTLYGGGN